VDLLASIAQNFTHEDYLTFPEVENSQEIIPQARSLMQDYSKDCLETRASRYKSAPGLPGLGTQGLSGKISSRYCKKRQSPPSHLYPA
jgi:hypothetical protein